MILYYSFAGLVNTIEAWLSLVERCVRDAEVASSNLVASIFYFLQFFIFGYSGFLCLFLFLLLILVSFVYSCLLYLFLFPLLIFVSYIKEVFRHSLLFIDVLVIRL